MTPLTAVHLHQTPDIPGKEFISYTHEHHTLTLDERGWVHIVNNTTGRHQAVPPNLVRSVNMSDTKPLGDGASEAGAAAWKRDAAAADAKKNKNPGEGTDVDGSTPVTKSPGKGAGKDTDEKLLRNKLTKSGG